MSDTRGSEAVRGVLDVEALLGNNPAADIDQVRRVSVLVEELRRTGVEGAGYQIESPYERRCVIRPGARAET
jgi:hypothetical protein